MKRRVLVFVTILIAIMISLCSCSKTNKELRNIEVQSISVVFDFDEKLKTYNSDMYLFNIIKSNNTSIQDYCSFTFYEERKSEWWEDSDGTRHFHTTGGENKTLEYDVKVFKTILDIINKGNPSIYTSPEKDDKGELLYKTLPYMIIIKGIDNTKNVKTIYVDSIDNMKKLLDTIESYKK